MPCYHVISPSSCSPRGTVAKRRAPVPGTYSVLSADWGALLTRHFHVNIRFAVGQLYLTLGDVASFCSPTPHSHRPMTDGQHAIKLPAAGFPPEAKLQRGPSSASASLCCISFWRNASAEAQSFVPRSGLRSGASSCTSYGRPKPACEPSPPRTALEKSLSLPTQQPVGPNMITGLRVSAMGQDVPLKLRSRDLLQAPSPNTGALVLVPSCRPQEPGNLGCILTRIAPYACTGSLCWHFLLRQTRVSETRCWAAGLLVGM